MKLNQIKFEEAVILNALKDITDKIQDDLEDKLSCNLFDTIGHEAEILMSIHVIANELQLFDK